MMCVFPYCYPTDRPYCKACPRVLEELRKKDRRR